MFQQHKRLIKGIILMYKLSNIVNFISLRFDWYLENSLSIRYYHSE